LPLAEQIDDPEAKRPCSELLMITSGSRNEPKNEQQAGHSQGSCSIREIARELAAMGYTKHGAPYRCEERPSPIQLTQRSGLSSAV
jgi:hypothetical protein